MKGLFRYIILSIAIPASIILTFVIFIIIISFLWGGSDHISKTKIRRNFASYNEEYSLNLPKDFDVIATYNETAIDGYDRQMIVKVDSSYKLEYSEQCVQSVHEEFDLIDHFELGSDNSNELLEASKTLSNNYDWYAYEEDRGARTYCLIVIRDYETDYLFVYYICSQYTDCF